MIYYEITHDYFHITIRNGEEVSDGDLHSKVSVNLC